MNETPICVRISSKECESNASSIVTAIDVDLLQCCPTGGGLFIDGFAGVGHRRCAGCGRWSGCSGGAFVAASVGEKKHKPMKTHDAIDLNWEGGQTQLSTSDA